MEESGSCKQFYVASIKHTAFSLNWGSVGIFGFDLVSWICGGPESMIARVIFTLVGLAGVWCISLLFR
ncbi:MAG: DUF378 domain-containing protein, partial [Clostridia bacterium]|nr:DUF378 domain-containing protein [Clostridia bacterium]